MNILILLCSLAVSNWKICTGFEKKPIKCKETQLAIYSLEFEARWTKENFPKQYPEWRPPAQWSNLIGITHDERYNFFRIGEFADESLKTFAETGKIDFGKNQTNVENYIYDEFFSPAVKSGAGKSEVDFFVDGNHSLVSVAVKIVPSPDWFVGVDAYNLCSEGNWIDTITVEASPIDAGTDSGFTFTAPNWKTKPQEPIFEITSRYPRHPANSFYYPKLEDLPPIAVFKIEKKNLYSLVEMMPNKKHQNDQAPTELPLNIIDPSSSKLENETRKNVGMIVRKQKSVSQRMKCKVSEWSQWSECSSTCGSGLSIRTRKIVHGNNEKSRHCPHLKQEKVCHVDSDCSDSYFKW